MYPIYRTLFFALCLSLVSVAVHAEAVDAKVVTLIDNFMQALQEPDLAASEQQILPLIHDSLKNNDKTGLKRQVREMEFAKAIRAAGRYPIPVNIVRVKQYDQTSVNLGPSPEAGHLFDYFIEKKDPQGLPAPIKIFIPANGNPVITNFGSL